MKQRSLENLQELREKINALLIEYGAEVTWVCDPCSDTHGIHGDKVVLRYEFGHIPELELDGE